MASCTLALSPGPDPAYEIPTYVQGTLVEVTVIFENDAGARTDTTLAVTLTVGGGLRRPPPVTPLDTGIYTVNLDTTPASGEWLLRVVGTGAVRAAAEAVFEVTSTGQKAPQAG